jgi:hypothetical protein
LSLTFHRRLRRLAVKSPLPVPFRYPPIEPETISERRLFAGLLFASVRETLLELLGNENRRLLDSADGKGRFRYRDNRDKDRGTGRGRRKTTRMPLDTFLSRVLEHVPPPGLQMVRAAGVYASAKRDALAAARGLLGQAPLEPVGSDVGEEAA